jgi:probable rRNA maturation factor
LPLKKIKSLFDLVIEDEAEPGWSATVNLVFTTDRRIQALNKRYRNRDAPTDVLSFAIDDPDQEDGTFGEIYISAETARRQAAQYGETLTNEYLRLFCHGLLHLLGYDHEVESSAEEMNSRQERYLERVL